MDKMRQILTSVYAQAITAIRLVHSLVGSSEGTKMGLTPEQVK